MCLFRQFVGTRFPNLARLLLSYGPCLFLRNSSELLGRFWWFSLTYCSTILLFVDLRPLSDSCKVVVFLKEFIHGCLQVFLHYYSSTSVYHVTAWIDLDHWNLASQHRLYGSFRFFIFDAGSNDDQAISLFREFSHCFRSVLNFIYLLVPEQHVWLHRAATLVTGWYL